MNVLLNNIANVCAEHLVDEKWLIAPSLRAGYQWADAVSRSGRPILNLRIKTFRGIALELAGPALAERGLKLLSSQAGEILAHRAWNGLQSGKKKLRYLAALQAGRSLSRKLFQTLNDLRMAGLAPAELRPQKFDVREKAGDLSGLLAAYIALLQAEHRADYACALELAKESLKSRPVPKTTLLLVPDDVSRSLHPLEREILAAIPDRQRFELHVDEPQTLVPDETHSDAALLRWLPDISNAPKPASDGTLEIFRAAGEINEVREVLRRIVSRGLKLDEVELLHTDSETYIPLLYEEAERLGNSAEGGGRTLPVTFFEGVPCRFSRPGRALTAWISWIGEDFPQTTLIRMIRDGLLDISGAGNENFSRFAQLLRTVPILKDRERYKNLLDKSVASLERKLSAAGDDESAAGIRERLGDMKKLRDIVIQLLKITPQPMDPIHEVLESAVNFLTEFARCTTEFDNNARNALRISISELQDLLKDNDLLGGIEAHAWLSALPNQVRVGGSSPRPGQLHCAHYLNGGHSGRPHTFILGLDDSRFPGAGSQDPLLLDAERHSLSHEKLESSSGRVHGRLQAFHELVARLRGEITLGYSCRNVIEDREKFPSSALMNAFRLVCGIHTADQHQLEKALPLPVSFVPHQEALCFDESDWWLWRLHDSTAIRDSRKLIDRVFPHLGRGAHAAEMRKSPIACEYDGLVPEAGVDHNPLSLNGPVMSTRRLEMIGRCPLSYFFAYILGIQPPDDVDIDPHRWLDALSSGQLLHDVFRDFILQFISQDAAPNESSLMKMLERTIKQYADETPFPSETVYQKECRELETAIRIFLKTGRIFDGKVVPAFVEASIGLPGANTGPLDTPDPVAVSISPRESVRICGRLDRVDRIADAGENCFGIVDYKTGMIKKCNREDPFEQGRVLQHALYLEMARSALQKAFPGALVASFSFVYASARGGGEAVVFEPKDLADGKTTLRNICQIASSGAFLATDNDDDCSHCAYRPICRDVDEVTAASKVKLQHAPNKSLAPFRELRMKGEDRESDASS